MDTKLIGMFGLIAVTAVVAAWTLLPRGALPRWPVDWWSFVENAIGLGLMLGMLYAASAQVVIRYALADLITIPWTEEFSRLLLVWGAFWGAMMVQRSDDHLNVPIVFNLFPPRVQLAVRLLGDLAILAFLMVIVWYGWQAARLQLGSGISLDLPVALFGYSVPVCGAGMMLYTIGLMIRRVRRQPIESVLDSGG
ncbi:MAG: TRAP transporter small permease [Chloroflexi bacterium]|nr:TRAP transporter small permease [Chloroflexota bacterium]